MPNKKPWWIWALAALGVLVLASPLLVFLIWPRIERVALARFYGHDQPCLWNTLTALPDLSISPSRGQTLSYSGIAFNVPWDDLVGERRIEQLAMDSWNFHSGQLIRVYVGGPEPVFMDGGLSTAKTGVDPEMKAFELERSIAQSTPSRVHLWGPQQAELGFMLTKSLRMDRCERPEVFYISTPTFKGFQYGIPKPGRWDSTVGVRLFSTSRTIIFNFQGAYPHSPVATQADINLIVQSLREAPGTAAPTSAPANP